MINAVDELAGGIGERAVRRSATGLVAALVVAAQIVASIGANYVGGNMPAWSTNPVVLWVIIVGTLSLWVVTLRRVGPAAGDPTAAISSCPKFGKVTTSLRPPRLDRQLRGRVPELARIRELSRTPAGRYVVICGAGGMGKSALAAAAAYQAAIDGLAVFWVRHRDASDLAGRFAEVAVATGLPPATVERAQRANSSMTELVWDHLDGVRGWVLIIDNLDRPEEAALQNDLLNQYCGWIRPSAGGLLVVTTRDRHPDVWGNAAELIELGPLTDSAGAELLLDAAPHGGDRREAEALSARLGGLPLALRAAAASVTEPTGRHRTFASYSAALDDRSTSLLPSRPDAAEPTVARRLVGYTWELSLDQLDTDGICLARPILRLLSLLADAPIPRSLITPDMLMIAMGQTCHPGQIDAAFAHLRRYNLLLTPDLDQTHGILTVVLHRLVRETNTILLRREGDAPAFRSAVDHALRTTVDELVKTGRAGRDIGQLFAPHLSVLSGLGCPTDGDYVRARDTLNTLAEFLSESGRYGVERYLRDICFAHDERYFERDDTRVIESRGKLADVMHNLSRYHEAADLHRDNLSIRERVHGAEHAETLENRNRLASTLSRLGRHEEAAGLHMQIIQIRERILGPDHLDTVRSRNNLANTLDDLGSHQEAADLRREAHVALRQMLGPYDRRTLQALNNLAHSLSCLKQFPEAMELYQQARDSQERTLAEDHPDTLTTYANLGEVWNSLGRHQAVVDLLGPGLATCEGILGTDHPTTLRYCHHLADGLSGVGRYLEAVNLFEVTLQRREAVLGRDDPDTLDSRQRLTLARTALRRRTAWRWRMLGRMARTGRRLAAGTAQVPWSRSGSR